MDKCPRCGSAFEFGILEQQLATVTAERDALKDPAPGDIPSQAAAWVAVYRALEEAGLLSFLPEPLLCPSRERCVQFIRHQSNLINDLKQQLAAGPRMMKGREIAEEGYYWIPTRHDALWLTPSLQTPDRDYFGPLPTGAQ